MSEVYVRNRQRTRPVNVKLLESIAAELIPKTGPGEYRVGILLVSAREMARLNEAYLQHAGPTDVLAFGYAVEPRGSLHGEVFICLDEAMRQARRFRTRWEKELVRYLVHGVLHFRGYNDGTRDERRQMQRVENALLQELARRFCLSQLSRKSRVRP